MGTRRKPRVVDLFAGAGLLSSAFANERYVITRAIERESAAAETYRANLGNHIEVGDITSTAPEGDCDVLIAGPPCQGFSTLGRQYPLDPRNQLSLEVAKWARKLRPKFVLVENVAAFVDSPVWASLRRRLRRDGYDVQAVILDALDFGVPQIRKRSFTLASKIGFGEIKSVTREPVQTVRQAWKGLPSVPNGKRNHFAPEPSATALARMNVIPSGGDKRDVMKHAPELAPPSWWTVRCQVTDAWGRLRWDQPANTLRTALQNASKGRYTHPDQNRVITLREAARLHSIPDDWEFCGLHTQIARQIGNSVPPLLGRAIARMIRRLLS